MSQTNRALIVDTKHKDRLVLSKIVELAFPDMAVDVVENYQQAQSMISQSKYYLALIEIDSGDQSGLALIAHIRLNAHPIHVIATSPHYEETLLARVLRSGAEGYLLKHEDSDDLVFRLRGLSKGCPPLSPQITRQLIRSHSLASAQGHDDNAPLTAKEREVLSMIAGGFKVREAADRLGISQNTISTHVKRLYTKLNISTRAEAAIVAMRFGLL